MSNSPQKADHPEARVNVRPYDEADRDGVIAVMRDLATAELQRYDRTRPPEEWGPQDIDEFEREIAKSRGHRLVAELDGTVVGYCNLHLHRDTRGDQDESYYEYAHIGDLGVLDRHRGHGIGSKLIARCEEIVRKAGIGWLQLNVSAANERGRRFYASHGFGEVQIKLEKKL